MVRQRICEALVEQHRFAEIKLGLQRRQWPEWLMLLDLYFAGQREMEVSFKELASVSGLSETTTFRRTTQLIDAQVLERIRDEHDRRRSFVCLAPNTRAKMDEIMDCLGQVLFA